MSGAAPCLVCGAPEDGHDEGCTVACGRCGKGSAAGAAGLCAACNEVADGRSAANENGEDDDEPAKAWYRVKLSPLTDEPAPYYLGCVRLSEGLRALPEPLAYCWDTAEDAHLAGISAMLGAFVVERVQGDDVLTLFTVQS